MHSLFGLVDPLPLTICLLASFLTYLGLSFIALGTGGIKPCVSAFGGDQFLPSQSKELQSFFSLFYVSINAGSLISTFITPILRQDVSCFGRPDCYPLAFGIPAILMIVAVVFFVVGKFITNYKCHPPQKDNIVVKCIKIICVSPSVRPRFKPNICFLFLFNQTQHALAVKWFKKAPRKDHWLEYADDKYDVRGWKETPFKTNLSYFFDPEQNHQ